MKRAILLGAVAAILAAAAVWYVYFRPSADTTTALTLFGNIDIRQVDLGFRVPGRVAEMRFEEGDVVKKGDILATLDKTPYRDDVRLAKAEVAGQRATLRKYETGSRPEEIAQARALVAERQAALENAEIALKRQAALVQKGHVAQQVYDDALARQVEAEARIKSAQDALDLQLDGYREEDIATAEANFQMAEARLAQANTSLSDTEILSPDDGVILNRVVEPGAIVAAGTPTYTLSLANPVWVRAYVSELNLGRIYPGMKATVTTDSAPDRPYVAQIGFISPVAEFTPKTVETEDLRTSLVYRLRVIVDAPDHGLRQGMPVTVHIAGGAAEETGR
ncbi:MAG: secretion protein HlyD [Pseudomonadota bacterium]